MQETDFNERGVSNLPERLTTFKTNAAAISAVYAPVQDDDMDSVCFLPMKEA